MEEDTITWIKSFARTGSISEKDLEILKKYEIPLESVKTIDAPRLWVEIGAGSGENSINQLCNNTDIFLISCEPYLKGLIKFVHCLERNKINNASVWPGDARYILKETKPNSIERIFILFPDPWPKRRHHKRRIINGAVLSMIYNKLIPGGELIISSDEQTYVHHIQDELKNYGKFDYFTSDEKHIENYVKTRYHKKALMMKRFPVFFYCKKPA